MKAWTGAVLAILMMGLVVFGLGLRAQPTAGALQRGLAPAQANLIAAQANTAPIVYAQAPVAGPFAQAPAMGQEVSGQAAPASQAPVLVSCGPGQQTLVRQVWVNGQPVSQVECVQGAPAQAVAHAGSRTRTVVYEPAVDDDVVRAPRVVRAVQAPVYRTAPRTATPRRTWQKSAMVIGGSTAAGAGVGGLVGGKKGALIGAALGGGASTIFEAAKRR